MPDRAIIREELPPELGTLRTDLLQVANKRAEDDLRSVIVVAVWWDAGAA